MNKRTGLTGLAALAGFTGLALFTVTADREFINLSPTEGQVSAVVLESGHTYTQTFPARRNNAVSRLGLFLRPATSRVASGNIIMSVESQDIKTSTEIPARFIDSEGPTQVSFSPAVPARSGSPIVVTIQVPENLSGQIRAQLRQPDETFDLSYADFAIDDASQNAPLAYQLYYREHPPLALQAGGLLLLTGLLLLIGRPLTKPLPLTLVATVLPLLYAIPVFSRVHSGLLSLRLIVIQAVAFAAMAWWLKRFSLHPAAILLGAAVFACTTWWPLHFASTWHWTPEVTGGVTNLKDIFLDPRQVPSASEENWEHFGSYIGVISTTLALIGLTVSIGQKKFLFVLALTVLALGVAVRIPDLIIITTLGLAFFAAQGLQVLYTFIGKDRLTTALVFIIAIIVLLDLFHVGTRTLQYGWL